MKIIRNKLGIRKKEIAKLQNIEQQKITNGNDMPKKLICMALRIGRKPNWIYLILTKDQKKYPLY